VAEEKPKKRKLDRTRIKSLLHEAGVLIWRSRGRLLLALPLMLINRLAGIVIPGTTKYLIDDVLSGKQPSHKDLLWKVCSFVGSQSPLMTLAAIAAVAGAIVAITDYTLAQILGMAAQKSITELRRRLHDHVQRLPVSYFDNTKTGTVVSRVMNDAEGIRNLVGTGILQLFSGIVTATIVTGILFHLSARLSSVILGAVFVFSFVLAWAFNTARPLFKKRSEVMASISGRLTEGVSGIRVVKAYRAERHEARVFGKSAHELLRLVLGTMRVLSGVGAMTSLLVGLASVTVMVIGGREVLAHHMSIGELMTFVLYLGLVVGPIVQIVSIGTQLSEAFAGLERMREVFGETREDEGDRDKEPLAGVQGDLDIRDLWFEYSPGVPVLKGVSLRAPAGTSVALVGPSGSGKSTLISLVATFIRPTSGHILVDGRDLATIRLADYRSHIGIVPQDSFLFADSIYDNIALGNPRASREEVLRAAHIAHVDEFAESFADGYGTVVGERGVKLSGGQKQRVAIARAIVADPRILILDEATSSLDSESEALIQDGLRTLMQGRTTFVIAHRLSTIRNADQIAVLEGGEIVERGTHAELMALAGRYRTLYEKQYGVVVNRFVNQGEEIPDIAVEVG
jgi:ABC-type multidrug transport system fused ATPase/permease subunit